MRAKDNQLDLVDELLNVDPFAVPDERIDELFKSATLTEIEFQITNNPKYRNYITRKLDVDTQVSLDNLPAVPAQVFKELGGELSSVSNEDIRFQLQSSATSGIPSTVTIDSVTSRRQARAMSNVMQKVLGSSKSPMLIVDAEPTAENRNALGARFAAVVGYLKFASHKQFLLEGGKDSALALSDKTFQILDAAVAQGEPVIIFGFTFVLYKSLLSELNNSNRKFNLPHGSKVIHIGGWKKLEDEKISPNEFKKVIDQTLGIKDDSVYDIYGFTEQMGLNYVECKYGWKHVPAYARIRVLDSESAAPLDPGSVGLLEFTSPIPHSYPGNRVLTDDMGFINPSHECLCGWGGSTFKMTGRRKKAEIRGCGDILGESLLLSKQTGSDPQTEGVSIDFPLREQPLAATPAATINEIVHGMNSHHGELQNISNAEIIHAISKLRAEWIRLEAEGSLAPLRNHGLGFLIEWSSPSNLKRILEDGLRGGASSLDGFVSTDRAKNRYIFQQSRGLVCQWVSGNVPMLGMFALIQAWLTKSPSLIRVSSSGEDMMAVLLEPLNSLATTSNSCRLLRDTVTIVSFARDNLEAQTAMSLAAKTRIAWGGGSAIASITELPKSPETLDLVYGPRTSFQIIDESFITNEVEMRRLARKVAADTFVFNQIACASPHSLFIRTTDKTLAEKFGIHLNEQMLNAEKIFPPLAMDEALAGQVRLARAVADFTGWSMGPGSLTHSVLFSDAPGLPVPSFGRTIVIKSVADEMDVVPYIHSQVQSIGMALPEPSKWTFAKAASHRGAVRFPEIGRMTNFDSPWDGKYMFDSFTKTVVLGGPNQY